MIIEDAIVLLGSMAVVTSVMVLIWAFRPTTKSSNSGGPSGQPGYSIREATLQQSLLHRAVAPIMRSIGTGTVRFTPVGWLSSQRKLLQQAGLADRYTAEQLLGVKIGGLAFGLMIGVVRFLNAPITLMNVGMTLAVIFIGFLGPDVLLRSRATERQNEITRLLPDFLDQLTISVEAGLGFEAAMARMVQADENYLTIEFGRMLRDVRLGTRRVDAMQAVVERTQVDDIKTMVLTLRQADTLGVPLARSLRSLSGEMREKRRFRAEEIAHRLPVKMIFPLAVCIMPALFIIMLGPAMLQFSESF